MNKLSFYALFVAVFSLFGCNNSVEQAPPQSFSDNVNDVDPHSYSEPSKVSVRHLDLDVQVDFQKQLLYGSAEWTLIKNDSKADEVIFDTYNLVIDSILLDNNVKTSYHIGAADEILGSALSVKINPTTQKVKIFYKTSPKASALQWLEQQQTHGKKYPFLYTQGESIYTRSWIPCQDAPAVRVTYNAKVQVPPQLMAVMSAQNDTLKNTKGVYHFQMQQAIPAYLIALAVGDISFQSITNKMGVFAEPIQLAACAKELEDMGNMMQAAEALYGSYLWDRYDVLFLPAAFPFGGMENPRLTFATPTILTGDKSLVNLIAHELAHSWSGNLVTNATWNDFWLNESFTVYFERRIMEALNGAEYAAMLWDLGIQDLRKSIEAYQGNKLPYTKLSLDLNGLDPDLGLTDFAYEKGAAMLLLIEQTIGRNALDSFLIQYFSNHKFTSISTAQFDKYISETLFTKYPFFRKQIAFDEWVYSEGLPVKLPKIKNSKFEAVDASIASFLANDRQFANTQLLKQWSTFEWLHFLRGLDGKITIEQMAILDKLFELSATKNAEIATIWYVMGIKAGYKPSWEPMLRFIEVTGRMKFLEPIYEAMYRQPSLKKQAAILFEKNKQNYHPIAQKSIAKILKLF